MSLQQIPTLYNITEQPKPIERGFEIIIISTSDITILKWSNHQLTSVGTSSCRRTDEPSHGFQPPTICAHSNPFAGLGVAELLGAVLLQVHAKAAKIAEKAAPPAQLIAAKIKIKSNQN